MEPKATKTGAAFGIAQPCGSKSHFSAGKLGLNPCITWVLRANTDFFFLISLPSPSCCLFLGVGLSQSVGCKMITLVLPTSGKKSPLFICDRKRVVKPLEYNIIIIYNPQERPVFILGVRSRGNICLFATAQIVPLSLGHVVLRLTCQPGLLYYYFFFLLS